MEILFASVFFLVSVVFVSKKIMQAKFSRQMDFFETRMKEFMVRHQSYATSTINDLQDSELRLMVWKEDHPMGPITSEEHDEWIDLILQHIGSYMLFCQAHNRPILRNYIDSIWEEIEEWRLP